MDTSASRDRTFTGSKLIRVSPDACYAFFADISNLPSYLAMVKETHDAGPDRIGMTINLHGHEHSDSGPFMQMADQRRIEWGSDAGDYSGSLEARDEDGDTRVEMAITWAAESPFPERMGDSEEDVSPVDDAIEATLQSIKNILEGKGGAVHPDEEGA